jgi:antitoxin (DNA-binding transcriptional repressor) of toxin-antitoxin stability system
MDDLFEAPIDPRNHPIARIHPVRRRPDRDWRSRGSHWTHRPQKCAGGGTGTGTEGGQRADQPPSRTYEEPLANDAGAEHR